MYPVTEIAELIFIIILFIVGFALAYAGIWVFESAMSLIGSLIGGGVGFIIAKNYISENLIVIFLVALIGAIIGAVLFNYFAKGAFALLTGLFVFLLISTAIKNIIGSIIGIIFGIIISAIAIVYIEEFIGILTALLGAILVSYAIFSFNPDVLLTVGIAILIFLSGAGLQISILRMKKEKELPKE